MFADSASKRIYPGARLEKRTSIPQPGGGDREEFSLLHRGKQLHATTPPKQKKKTTKNPQKKKRKKKKNTKKNQ